jgi:formylglycine-generating enzyme required for sulfatase activity
MDVSPFGVLDMAGNVSEWVADLYSLYPGNPGQILASEKSHRVVRGAGITYGLQYARLTRRMSHSGEITSGQHTAIGFRCSSDVQTIRNAYLKSRTR